MVNGCYYGLCFHIYYFFISNTDIIQNIQYHTATATWKNNKKYNIKKYINFPPLECLMILFILSLCSHKSLEVPVFKILFLFFPLFSRHNKTQLELFVCSKMVHLTYNLPQSKSKQLSFLTIGLIRFSNENEIKRIKMELCSLCYQNHKC